MDDALKTRNIKIFKCWNSVAVCPPIKISGYAPGCHCYYIPKDLVVLSWFYLCSLVVFSSSTLYFGTDQIL